MIDKALEYAEFVPVYRLNSNTKIPIKDSSGHLDATQDMNQIKAWWNETPDANIACVPATNGYFVLDVDQPHGIETLEQLGIWQRIAQENNFQAYKTTGGGLHFWFKTDSDVIMDRSRIDLWKNVDVLSTGHGVIVPPSIVNGSSYTGDLDFSKVPDVPEWLERIIEQEIKSIGKFKPKKSKKFKLQGKTYTGNLLDHIVEGSDKGNRNVWLTSVTGSLFNTGMNGRKLYDFLHVINQNYIEPSLPAREVDTIFKSIGNRFISDQSGGK